MTALANDENSMFDIQVSSENLTVAYMRSLLVEAGPIRDGNKRY